METQIPGLRKELLGLTHLAAAISLLGWDQMANMSTDHNGHDARSTTIAALQEMSHSRFISPEMETLLFQARLLKNRLSEDDRLIVENTQKDFEKAKKISPEFVAETQKLYGESYIVWVNARKKSDFGMFAPNLKKIIKFKRQEAEMLGYVNSPYDALLDEYEPGLTVARIDPLFSTLKNFIMALLPRIIKNQDNNRPPQIKVKIDIVRQTEFIKQVVTELGYDFKSGHLGQSVHPFSSSQHPTDARITVRYDEHNVIGEALYSAIHEAGHAMYEQNLPQEHYGTHLGESVSLGVHESQSRFWENIIGRSLEFWQHFYPLLKESFPALCDIYTSPEAVYKAVNFVEPSLIRTDADEVTYNLHIIVRYELERDLIEGRLEVNDLPVAWNKKMKDYFGLDVPDDRSGVLQDMHWADGSFGYFPTYTLGNLYSAQINESMRIFIPGLDIKIREGEFKIILEWLRDNIHRHGSRYEPEELIRRATGKSPEPHCFNNYLLQKYSRLYNL